MAKAWFATVILFSNVAMTAPRPMEKPWVRKIVHSVQDESASHTKASLQAFYETTKDLLNLHMDCEQSGGISIIEGVKTLGCVQVKDAWKCAEQGSVVCLTYFDTGMSPQKRTEGLIDFATGARQIGFPAPNPEFDFQPLRKRYYEVYKQ